MKEVFRVLKFGGRFVLFQGTKDLRGTPAAPEPIASRVRFYENDELINLAEKAGFSNVVVENPDLERFAIEEGIPSEALNLFAHGTGSQLMVAIK